MNKCTLKIVGSCCCNPVPSKVCGVGLLWKLLYYARVLHLVFEGLVTQLYSPASVCVCVECGHTCVYRYTKLTFRLHHAQHSCTVFTTLWCGCSVIKLTLYLHQAPSWLWLVWTNSPVFTPPGYRSVGTTSQIMPRLRHIMDTHQFLEYPDSTISKILTVLKWQIITMLNRKLLEKQRVQNCFASYEVYT